MLMKRCSAVLPALLICALAVPAAADSHGKAPTPLEVVKRLGYSDAQIEQLKQGKIIAIDLERARGDQLIAAVAARIDAPLASLAENVKKGMNIQRDAGVLAFGEISGADEGFAKVVYDSSESSEIKRLLGVKASDTFNLSSEEIASLQGAFKGVKAEDAETVSQAYRDVLKGRLGAYLKGGLEGIAPYDHGGKSFSAAEELQAIYEQVKPFLSEFYPTFDKALGGFPKESPDGVDSKLYWIKRNVEGRPAFILAHQLVQTSDDYILMAQRQFFVGHTYDSLQVVTLALPVEGGTAVFYLNTAFTDKITGFFSGVAQSVGQGRMKEDLEKYFGAVRKAYAQ